MMDAGMYKLYKAYFKVTRPSLAWKIAKTLVRKREKVKIKEQDVLTKEQFMRLADSMRSCLTNYIRIVYTMRFEDPNHSLADIKYMINKIKKYEKYNGS